MQGNPGLVPPAAVPLESVMQDLNRAPSMVGLAAVRDDPFPLIGI